MKMLARYHILSYIKGVLYTTNNFFYFATYKAHILTSCNTLYPDTKNYDNFCTVAMVTNKRTPKGVKIGPIYKHSGTSAKASKSTETGLFYSLR